MQTPGPYRNRSAAPARCRGGSRSPASWASERGRDVEQDGPCRGKPDSDVTRSPVTISPPDAVDRRGHRVGDPRAAALHDRPADGVREQDEHQANAAGGDGGQRHHGVRGGTGQQGTGLLGTPAAGDRGGGQHAAGREAGHRQRVRGRAAQRGEHGLDDVVGVLGQRAQEALVGAAVGAEAGGGLGHVAGDDRGAAFVERLGELDLGAGEGDAARLQVKALEERGGQGQRVRRRADVVAEAGQGQFLGTAATADGGSALDHVHIQTGRGQRDGGGQAVRAAADDDRVVAATAHAGGRAPPLSARGGRRARPPRGRFGRKPTRASTPPRYGS